MRFVAAGAAMALALTACSSSPPAMLKADGVERVSADGSAYPAEFAQLRASARTLGAALLADGGNAGNGNVVSSPGSLLIALAMLRAGASGGTAAELDSVLGLPPEHRDAALNALQASLEAFDGDPGSVDEEDPPRRPVLGYAWDEVHDEPEVLEHAVSDTLMARIDALLDHPARDPHADPIPASDGRTHHPQAQQLSAEVAGQKVTICRVPTPTMLFCATYPVSG